MMGEKELRRLSQQQAKALKAELTPLLQPYFDHQGWPSINTADGFTAKLGDILKRLGVTW